MAIAKWAGKETASTFSGRYSSGRCRNETEDVKLIPLKLSTLGTTQRAFTCMVEGGYLV